MSAETLARRLGVSHAGVRKLESSEAAEAITLASLRNLAEALDCELRYELVPRTSLKEQLQERAEKVAQERLRPIAHSMALEDQSLQVAVIKLQMAQVVKNLLEGSRRDLWSRRSWNFVMPQAQHRWIPMRQRGWCQRTSPHRQI